MSLTELYKKQDDNAVNIRKTTGERIVLLNDTIDMRNTYCKYMIFNHDCIIKVNTYLDYVFNDKNERQWELIIFPFEFKHISNYESYDDMLNNGKFIEPRFMLSTPLDVIMTYFIHVPIIRKNFADDPIQLKEQLKVLVNDIIHEDWYEETLKTSQIKLDKIRETHQEQYDKYMIAYEMIKNKNDELEQDVRSKYYIDMHKFKLDVLMKDAY